jgi:MFS superfamily sulfate permease-like transporter
MSNGAPTPLKQKPSYFQAFFIQDMLASLVGFLVAIPMSLGLAIASGVPAAYGMISAVVGCLTVGALTTAPLMVTGPAAGMLAITLSVVQQFGVEPLGLIVLLAGVIQLLMGVFKLGQLFRAITPAVIHGMMAGIGLIIIFSQLPVMLDVKPMGSAFENLLMLPRLVGVLIATPFMFKAGLISLVSLLTLFSFQAFPSVLKKLPAAFYAILAGSFTAYFTGMTGLHYIALPHNLLDGLHGLKLASFEMLLNAKVWLSAFAMAFIASSKALLTASATEALHNGQRTQNNKEMWVQGTGNVLCGLLGSIPISGEILRSMVNIKAGAYTRYALVMTGVWLLLFVGLFPQYLEQIPVSCLAALLVYTGLQLLGLDKAKELAHFGKREVAIFIVTALAVAFIDPLEGVLIGMVFGLLNLCLNLSGLLLTLEGGLEEVEGVQHIRLQGKGTFINLPKLASTLEALSTSKRLLVKLDELTYVDHAFYEFMQSWATGYGATGGHITLDWQRLEQLLHQHQSKEVQPEEAQAKESPCLTECANPVVLSLP